MQRTAHLCAPALLGLMTRYQDSQHLALYYLNTSQNCCIDALFARMGPCMAIHYNYYVGINITRSKIQESAHTIAYNICYLDFRQWPARCYKQNLSLSFFFISFLFVFIFHLISTISQLIPISYLLFLHYLHLVGLSHCFISISLSISISGTYSSSRVLSIVLVLLSFESGGLSIAVQSRGTIDVFP